MPTPPTPPRWRVPPSPTADAAKARSVDAAGPGEGWTCFGDAGIGAGAGWVAHWAPGATETLLSPQVGYPMPPGSLLVMQVHYNLLNNAGGADQSSIRMRLTDAGTQLDPLVTARLLAPIELPCPAGETGPLCERDAAIADVTKRFGEEVGGTEDQLVRMCANGTPTPGTTQHCDQPVRQAATIYAVAGHMHLLGRSIKIELNPGTPTARTRLDVPVFNFDDQAIHPLATPLPIKPGDTFRVTCSYDAGLRKLLPQLRTLPPLRRVGRRHQRRDVPGLGGLVPEGMIARAQAALSSEYLPFRLTLQIVSHPGELGPVGRRARRDAPPMIPSRHALGRPGKWVDVARVAMIDVATTTAIEMLTKVQSFDAGSSMFVGWEGSYGPAVGDGDPGR